MWCPKLPSHQCNNGMHGTCLYSTGGHTPNKVPQKMLATVEFEIIPYRVLLFLNYLPYFFFQDWAGWGSICRNSRESTENEG